MSGVGRLVVGMSGSPGSLQALRYEEGLARAHHAVLIPVIAWELPGGDRAHQIGLSHELGKAYPGDRLPPAPERADRRVGRGSRRPVCAAAGRAGTGRLSAGEPGLPT